MITTTANFQELYKKWPQRIQISRDFSKKTYLQNISFSESNAKVNTERMLKQQGNEIYRNKWFIQQLQSSRWNFLLRLFEFLRKKI